MRRPLTRGRGQQTSAKQLFRLLSLVLAASFFPGWSSQVLLFDYAISVFTRRLILQLLLSVLKAIIANGTETLDRFSCSHRLESAGRN